MTESNRGSLNEDHARPMSEQQKNLLPRIEHRECTVGVLGFDTDTAKPEALGQGESCCRHVGSERVGSEFAPGRIVPTTSSPRVPFAVDTRNAVSPEWARVVRV